MACPTRSCNGHVVRTYMRREPAGRRLSQSREKKICFSRTSRKPEPLRAAQRDPKIESRSVSWIGSTIVAARRKRTTGEKGEENPFSLNFSELATSGPPLALSTRETFRFQLEKTPPSALTSRFPLEKIFNANAVHLNRMGSLKIYFLCKRVFWFWRRPLIPKSRAQPVFAIRHRHFSSAAFAKIVYSVLPL